MFENLKPDPESDICLHEIIKGDTAFFIAELRRGKTLSAHYHTEGSEIYHILSGSGKMEIGELCGGKPVWNKRVDVAPHDVFEIKPNVVHRLSNDGKENLKIVFITPASHLGDDRIFI